MSTTTNTSGAISKQKNSTITQNSANPKNIRSYIKIYEGEIAKALPSVLTPERFSRMVLTAMT